MTAWNVADQGATGGSPPYLSVSGDGLTVSTTQATHVSTIRSTWSASTGKWYWEVTRDANADFARAGIANPAWGVANYIAQNTGSLTGQHNAGASESASANNHRLIVNGLSSALATSTEKFDGAADVAQFALDADAGKLWIRVNGGAWAGGGDPAAGTSPTFTLPASQTWHAAASLRSTGSNTTLLANFGASAFAGTAPSGFAGPFDPAVSAAHVHRYALLARVGPVAHVHPYGETFDVGPVAHVHAYASRPGARSVHRYDLLATASASHVHPYASRPGSRSVHRYALRVGPVACVHRYGSRVTQQAAHVYALLAPVAAACRHAYASTTPVAASHVHAYDLRALNPVLASARHPYDLTATVRRVITDQPVLRLGTQRMEVLAAVLAAETDGWGWSGTVQLARLADYVALERDAEVTLALGAETYTLLVDEKELAQDGPGELAMTVRLVSPAAVYTSPRSALLTRTWSAPVLASAAASEALGGAAITWAVVDWGIPGGRLAVTDAEPLEVARQIVAAAGGVLESGTDGSLRARPRFPVTVAGWAAAAVEHTFTDAADRLSAAETWRRGRRANRIAVRDLAGLDGHLAVEVDTRSAGLNGGTTSFAPGQTAWLLVYTGPGVQVQAVDPSSGALLAGAAQAVALEEDLEFAGVTEARLAQPAASVTSSTWLGDDLGTATLGADRQTLTIATAGSGLLRLRYVASARAYGVVCPASAGGETSYPVLVLVEGEQVDDRPGGGRVNIVVQRGLGDAPGEAVTEPLLGDLPVALALGRALLDEGEDLQVVRQEAVFRTGLAPGQLAETFDARQGAAWRGVVSSVEHRAADGRLTTLMEVLRA